ncbi:MAG TPA: FeoA family protein [Novosphingobium sp.]|nr:FeoA family protein [Novosphingobium sp.]HZV10418.1 FeoA family protein [Novosphingobium sp.]
MALDRLPLRCPARIVAVDWAALVPEEAKRLRALGLDVGARIRVAHKGVFFAADPLAISVGRMIVALRRVHARAMQVEPLPARGPHHHRGRHHGHGGPHHGRHEEQGA